MQPAERPPEVKFGDFMVSPYPVHFRQIQGHYQYNVQSETFKPMPLPCQLPQELTQKRPNIKVSTDNLIVVSRKDYNQFTG
jgi:hypothetical protein